MITDFEVKCRAISENVSLVEGVGRTELPGTYVVDALQQCIERVVLGG